MFCEHCGSKLYVTDTTHIEESNDIYRFRKCNGCGAKYTSVEMLVEPNEDFYRLWYGNSRWAKNHKNRRKEEND